MKIISWITYPEAQDYSEAPFDDEHREAVINWLVDNHKIIYGDEHQAYNFKGVPLFMDGALTLSMRTWGAVMATAANRMSGSYKYTYIDYYLRGGINV